jgi:hypothetical protein
LVSVVNYLLVSEKRPVNIKLYGLTEEEIKIVEGRTLDELKPNVETSIPPKKVYGIPQRLRFTATHKGYIAERRHDK